MITFKRANELLCYSPETGEMRWRTNGPNRRAVSIAGGIYSKMRRGKIEKVPQIMLDYKSYRLPRIAYLLMTGEWPKHQIDHVNGDRSDNRWSNLRDATNGQNGQNRGMMSSNTSGYKGVYKCRNKWRARIRYNKLRFSLGSYVTRETAYEAYSCVARILHGEYARLEEIQHLPPWHHINEK